MRCRIALVLLVALAAAAACSSGGGSSSPSVPIEPPPSQGPPQTGPEGKYLKHVVVIVQENRTFNDIFAGFKGADSTMYGYTHTGAKVKLRPMSFKGPDIFHNWPNAMSDWNHGAMNGFDRETYTDGKPAGTYTYAYIDHKISAPYWTMAREYALADHMFPTMFGPTFTAHIDLIASTTNLSADIAEVDGPTGQPWGCDAPAGTHDVCAQPAARGERRRPVPVFHRVQYHGRYARCCRRFVEVLRPERAVRRAAASGRRLPRSVTCATGPIGSAISSRRKRRCCAMPRTESWRKSRG